MRFLSRRVAVDRDRLGEVRFKEEPRRSRRGGRDATVSRGEAELPVLVSSRSENPIPVAVPRCGKEGGRRTATARMRLSLISGTTHHYCAWSAGSADSTMRSVRVSGDGEIVPRRRAGRKYSLRLGHAIRSSVLSHDSIEIRARFSRSGRRGSRSFSHRKSGRAGYFACPHEDLPSSLNSVPEVMG